MPRRVNFRGGPFNNGKLDLVEIEGLADLIAAETEMQRRLAVEHSSGHLSALYQAWSGRLTHARAMIEAELDFADEDDVPGSVAAECLGGYARSCWRRSMNTSWWCRYRRDHSRRVKDRHCRRTKRRQIKLAQCVGQPRHCDRHRHSRNNARRAVSRSFISRIQRRLFDTAGLRATKTWSRKRASAVPI